MKKTASGHFDHLQTPSFSFYTPTPFPSFEQSVLPPRDRQTLEQTLSASVVSLARVGYVLFIVAPIHLVAALASHAIWPKQRWIERQWGRGAFPTRMPTWGLGQTIAVPLVGSLFWALVYGTPRGMGWEEESTLPRASKWLFGRGHEGWCIEAEGVTLPPLPTSSGQKSNGTVTKHNSHRNDNGNDSMRKRHPTMNGGANGKGPDKNFVDQAADATSLHTSTDADTLSRAPSPKPYDPISERIPTNLLRGQVEGSQFGVQPVPVAAFWQWKSMAAAVAHGQVISVKPGSDVAGIGSGPALSSDERMVLFFVGGGYHSGHAPQGPLSWSVCRQTSLRVLGVNFRKATSDKRAFPAALQDALAAWVYVTKRLHFKPENVILMGDSAGGGLALSLQLYLSSLMWSSETSMGRAQKLVLHSPMTDLTLSTDSFTSNNAVDIISPYMCSLARDNYLRHVMPVAGRKNAMVDDKVTGEANVAEVASRYNIDPYGLTLEQRRSEKVRGELARLAKELPETILELGAFHPLFSLGLDARKNKYLAQCLLLLDAPPAASGGYIMDMLVTAGTAEIFHNQIKLFVRNLHDLHPQDAKSGVKVSLVECIDWHHVFAYMNLPGKVKAQVDDVAKMFMLA